MFPDDVVFLAVVRLILFRWAGRKAPVEFCVLQAVRYGTRVGKSQSSDCIYCTARNLLGVYVYRKHFQYATFRHAVGLKGLACADLSLRQ